MRCQSQCFAELEADVLQGSNTMPNKITPQMSELKRPMVNVRVHPITDKFKENNLRLPSHTGPQLVTTYSNK